MKKVLIYGPNYFNYTQNVGKSFENLGWQTKVICYDVPVHPYNFQNKIRYKFSVNKSEFSNKNRQKNQDEIRKTYDEFEPNLVFLLNGFQVEGSTLKYFREKSGIIVWLFDTIKRSPYTATLIDYADVFCCFEKDDVAYFESNGKIAHFVPQACDTNTYFPIKNKKKDIDILFVGAIYGYKKRESYLKTVVRTFPQQKIHIYGISHPWYKNPLKWLFRKNRSIYKNKNVDSDKVNELYNRSKVVLNIHHETTVNSANPKVFEICGAGAYQVCDKNEYTVSLFSNNEIALYSNEEEMISAIKWALDNPHSEALNARSEAAQKYIHRQHTLTKRVEEMLTLLEQKTIAQ